MVPVARRLVRGATLVGALSALTVAGAWLVPAQRHEPAEMAAEADASLRAARAAHAERWAPMNLAQAENAYAQGLLDRRTQQLRLLPFRRFDNAERSFTAARDHADMALHLAGRARETLRRRAANAVGRALGALAPLDGIEDRVWVAPELRARLGRARALASEARSLMEAGENTRSGERAREAEAEAHALVDSLYAMAARYTNRDSLEAWRRAVAEAIAWSRRSGRAAVIVYKDEHRLALYQAGKLTRTYRVELGWNNLAYKRSQGDGATPEGRYSITQKKGPGASRYHRALLLDYPNADDRRALAEAKRQGLVHRAAGPGGLIEIHGDGGRGRDWTDGCVAVTNAEIDQLFSRVGVGTPVIIVGSGNGQGDFSELATRLAR